MLGIETKPVFVVTGTTGVYESKRTWVVNAYSTQPFADKARRYLQRLADTLAESSHVSEELYNELADADPRGSFDEYIHYDVEEIKIVC